MARHEVAGLVLEAPDVEVGRRSVYAHLWPSGVVLARLVAGPLAAALVGRGVIELGGGRGAPGRAAARAGAQVLLTDEEPEALALAAAQAAANQLTVEVEALTWGPVPERLRGAFDVVLGADVTYDVRQRRALLATVESLLAPDGHAYLADPERLSRRELVVHTSLAVVQVAREPAPRDLPTSDGSGDRDVVVFRLARAAAGRT